MPSTAAMLPSCTATPLCCTMQLGSPVCILRQWPKSLKKAAASGPKSQLVSVAIGEVYVTQIIGFEIFPHARRYYF